MPERIVQNIVFEQEGVNVEYITPSEDAKLHGVMIAHNISIPRGLDYDDEINALVDAATYLLNDILEDVPTMTPLFPEQPR